MPKTKLVTIFRGGFSSEVPTFDKNGTNIDVSKFQKINIAVPIPTEPPRATITFAQYQQMMIDGTFENNKTYEIQI